MKSSIIFTAILTTGLLIGCGDDNNETNNGTENNGTTNNGTTNNGTTNNGTTNNGTTGGDATAKLQVIHNSADPAAAVVDVYVNDVLTIDDFKFRTAAGFIDVPAGADLSVVIAGGDSASSADGIATFGPYNLAADSATVLVASGVLTPDDFSANPDGNSTAFDLYPIGDAELAGTDKNRFVIFHGATDAPAVDLVVGATVLVDGAAYGANTGYLDIPNGIVPFDLNVDANDARVASFQTPDVSDLGAVVVASGFLDASQNADAGFGIFAYAPTGGDAIPLDLAARLQVIHNAADPGAVSVDVYLNDGLGIDDFAFRTATPFITVASGVEIKVGIAPPTSADVTEAIATVPVTLEAGSTNQAIATGVLDPSMFAANPDAVATAFGLTLSTDAQEASTDATEVQFRVFHGATDAPTVDVVVADGGPTLVDDAAYGDLTGYVGVPAASYDIAVQTGDNAATVATYTADLSTLAGGAGIILASGFLTPADNQTGEAFELIFFTNAGGAGVALPAAN